jgi:hypothetical protein
MTNRSKFKPHFEFYEKGESKHHGQFKQTLLPYPYFDHKLKVDDIEKDGEEG